MIDSNETKLAWEHFQQNGTVGAYLLYRAVLLAEAKEDQNAPRSRL